jgi:hypothetical protein
MPDLDMLASQLIYVIATSDALPDLYAGINDTPEREGPDAVSFHASTEDGSRVKITLTADPM